jgi:hypothetical protein
MRIKYQVQKDVNKAFDQLRVDLNTMIDTFGLMDTVGVLIEELESRVAGETNPKKAWKLEVQANHLSNALGVMADFFGEAK